MPGMGGIRCLEEIQKQNLNVPVLIASGYAPTGKVKTTIDRKAQGFVGKPYTVEALLKMVRQVLDNQQTQ